MDELRNRLKVHFASNAADVKLLIDYSNASQDSSSSQLLAVSPAVSDSEDDRAPVCQITSATPEGLTASHNFSPRSKSPTGQIAFTTPTTSGTLSYSTAPPVSTQCPTAAPTPVFTLDQMQQMLSSLVKDFTSSQVDTLKSLVQNVSADASTHHKSNPQNIVSFLKECTRRGLQFSGSPHDNICSFFRRLDEVNRIYCISDDQLLHACAQQIFTNVAKTYYVAHRDEFSRWSDLQARYLVVFESDITDAERKRDMSDRTQVVHESITYYVATMKTLNSRLTKPMSEDDLLEMVLFRLHPVYKERVIDKRISSFDELEIVCRAYERLDREKANYRPPPAHLLKNVTDDPIFSEQIPISSHSLPGHISVATTQRPLSEVQCFGCQEFGHYRTTCPHRQRNRGQQNRSSAPARTPQATNPPLPQCVCPHCSCRLRDSHHKRSFTPPMGTKPTSSRHVQTDFEQSEN